MLQPGPPSSKPVTVDFVDPQSDARWIVRGVVLSGIGLSVGATHQILRAQGDAGILSLDNYAAYANAVAAALSLTAGVMALTWWAWVQWQRKLYKNTLSLKSSNRYAPKWVTLGWLLPIACFFVPKRMVDDAYFPRGRPGATSTDLITAWWGMGWATAALVAMTASSAEPTLQTVMAVFLILVSTILTAVTIYMVPRITEGQILRLHHVAAGNEMVPTVDRSPRSAATTGVLVSIVGIAMTAVVGMAVGFDLGRALARNVSLSEMSAGACFNGQLDATEVILTACDAPHDGQLVAAFSLSGDEYPGVETIASFSRRQCREHYELFSGIASDPIPPELTVATPDRVAWVDGTRSAYCVLGGIVGSPLRRFSAQNPTARVALADLEPEACYERDAAFVTLRPSACTKTAFTVHSVAQLTLIVDAPYPDNISEIGQSQCPPPNTAFLPTQAQWQEGLRYVLCAR